MGTGTLIAFEGIDGAGKTTQLELLRQALSKTREVVASKEPTDGHWGRQLRQSAQDGRLPAEQELDYFLKDRREHVDELIRPALDQGKIVLLDRYFYSTIAYQGARGLEVERLESANREIAPTPDLVVFLDIDPEVGLERISAGRGEVPNLFEKADYLQAARAIFQQLADRRPEIQRFDASRSSEQVEAEVLARVTSLLADKP